MESPVSSAQNGLLHAFALAGGRCAVLSAEQLPIVEKQWLSSHAEANGEERCLSNIRGAFDFTLSQGEVKIRSIVVAAMPSPPLAVEIDWPDGAFTAYLPPVYGGRAAPMAGLPSAHWAGPVFPGAALQLISRDMSSFTPFTNRFSSVA